MADRNRSVFRVWQIGTGQYSRQGQGVADRNKSVLKEASECARQEQVSIQSVVWGY